MMVRLKGTAQETTTATYGLSDRLRFLEGDPGTNQKTGHHDKSKRIPHDVNFQLSPCVVDTIYVSKLKQKV